MGLKRVGEFGSWVPFIRNGERESCQRTIVLFHPVLVVFYGKFQDVCDNLRALGGTDKGAGDEQVESDAGALPLLSLRSHLCTPDVGKRRIVSSLMNHFVVGAGTAMPHQGYL